MTLTIRNLTTNCLAPLQHASLKTVVDQFARNKLARELGQHLGPSLERQPEEVRIRRIAVHLEVRAADLHEDFLSRAWSEAFSRALFEAFAYPDGVGRADLRRYPSRAAYLAAVVREWIQPGGSPAWIHEEAKARYKSVVDFIQAVIRTEELALEPLLLDLYAGQALELLLAQLDDITIETLFSILSRSVFSPTRPVDRLLGIARAAAQTKAVHGWPLRGRRNAIRVWAQLVRGGTRWEPRAIWAALQVMQFLMDHPAWLTTVESGEFESRVTPPADEFLRDLRQEINALTPHAWAVTQDQLVQSIRVIAPAYSPIATLATPQATQTWLSSEAGGLLLLARVIDRLDWWRALPLPVFGYVLTGVGRVLAGDRHREDPAISILAGALEDFDHHGMIHYFATASPPAAELGLSAETWPEFFKLAAELLARRFAERIRGFRKASFEAIQTQVILRHGRILVEKERILVVLDSHPWNVALHLSGVDDPFTSVDWLGGRRLEFILESL